MEPPLKNAFRNSSTIPTTPSAPLRWLRIFFLMAQPPLLYQEGNCQPAIHSQRHRPPYMGIARSHSFFRSLSILPHFVLLRRFGAQQVLHEVIPPAADHVRFVTE